jgi:chitodextrinase
MLGAATTRATSSGLVAAYSFGEGSGGTVADGSGNGNTGTVQNATWTAAGKYGPALSFNGSNARVTIANASSLQLSGALTLEAWVNPTTVASAWRDVIYKGNDNYYLMGTTDHAGAAGGGALIGGSYSEVFNTSPLPTNTWSYLALTYDGTTERLYLNGALVASKTKTGTITSSTNPLTIGSDPIYGQYFNGLIDEVRVYNTALTATAIQTDMTTPVAGNSADTTPPTTPTGLTASAVGQTSMTLSWNPSTDDTGVTGYRTYLNGNQVGTSPSTSYGYSNLSCATTYTLGVAAVDAAGNVSGIATLAKQTAACSDSTPPSAPGTLTATGAASTEIDLAWGAATDNIGVTGYKIERCQGTGCTGFVQIGTATGTSYQDTGLAATTGYSYRVRATDAATNLGPYTNTASATTPSVPPTMYSVGGTASGLSGPIVLQDNGGDDLTVNGNGAFQFATKLPGGATYGVTVKTASSGQSCTVSGASGTVTTTNVSSVGVACTAAGPTSGSDDFNRADGGLGGAWAATSDGALTISSNAVIGSSATAGDVRTAETYGADQFSAIQLTSTQLTGGQWVGPAVRMQNNGMDMYLGIYFWNNGTPQLRLYERTAGNWIQLGGSYNSGPLAAGIVLKLSSVGSRIALSEGGVERIVASDGTLSAGQPGIMTFGAAGGDNWSAGPASVSNNTLQVDYTGTDANGVAQYNTTSPDDGGTQVMRVLAPTNPTPGVAHNFLFVLPVEAGLSTVYGDGLETLRALDAQDRYNLTIIEPSFGVEPWYADNPNDSSVRYETFLTNDLVPWVTQHLGTTGGEQKWLIGFSKSGIGATDLILKHPDVFTLAAAWDFPADMSAYDQFGSSSASSYGTNDNFLTGYRLTPSFIEAHKAPFLSKNRIWIGGYDVFQTDMTDFDALLSSEAVAHSTETPQHMQHRWDSGWVQIALAALQADSISLP